MGECLRANPLGRCQKGGSYGPGEGEAGRGRGVAEYGMVVSGVGAWHVSLPPSVSLSLALALSVSLSVPLSLHPLPPLCP